MAQHMKYYYELTISSSPHVHSPVTTTTIMRDVIIALLPALAGSVFFFGFRALTVTLVSVAACVFFEWLWCKLRKMPSKLYDLSAIVTGILLAFVCPPTIPYWVIILGAAFAILLVKMLFGGIGKNIVNPALAGRAFMFSWPVAMSTWVKVGFENAAPVLGGADIVTAATPLAAMHQGALPADSLTDMFLGNVGGCIGETSVVLLLFDLREKSNATVKKESIPKMLLYILATGLLIFCMEHVGIIVSVAVYIFCIVFFVEKHPIFTAIKVSIVTSALIYGIFHVWLQVPMSICNFF